MIKVNLNKEMSCPWGEALIRKVIAKIAVTEQKVKGEVEVNVVGDKKIRELNRVYRDKDNITDVLSFAWQEDKIILGDFLGQIYICYPQIIRQARENRIGVKEEFVRMLAHALLHLAGYEHQKKEEARKMFVRQERLIQKII